MAGPVLSPAWPLSTSGSAPDWHQNNRSAAVTASQADTTRLTLDGAVPRGQHVNHSQAIRDSQAQSQPGCMRARRISTELSRRLPDQPIPQGLEPRTEPNRLWLSFQQLRWLSFSTVAPARPSQDMMNA